MTRALNSRYGIPSLAGQHGCPCPLSAFSIGRGSVQVYVVHLICFFRRVVGCVRAAARKLSVKSCGLPPSSENCASQKKYVFVVVWVRVALRRHSVAAVVSFAGPLAGLRRSRLPLDRARVYARPDTCGCACSGFLLPRFSRLRGSTPSFCGRCQSE